MPHSHPKPEKHGAAAPTPGRSGDGPCVAVLLLLSEPGAVAAVRRLLQAIPGRTRVSHAIGLSDALVAMAADPPALAVIDGALCDALEREFVDHLLQTHADTQVLLLRSDEAELRPHPRLTRVSPHALLPAVGHWLVSVGGAAGTAA